MKINNKLFTLLTLLGLFLFALFTMQPKIALAFSVPACRSLYSNNSTGTNCFQAAVYIAATSGVDSGKAVALEAGSWGEEEPLAEACDASGDPAACLEKTGTASNSLWNVLKLAINILSGAILVAAVIMLIVGAIQYSSAGGDPNRVKAAKTRITNVLIGIVAYIFLYSFLQWLVPGGAF